MRIISKFRDYYDGVQSGYAKDDIVWVRTPKTMPNKYKIWGSYHDRSLTCKGIVYPMDRDVIGFCGKIYLGCSILPESEKFKLECKQQRQYFYSLEAVENWVKKVGSPAQIDDFYR